MLRRVICAFPLLVPCFHLEARRGNYVEDKDDIQLLRHRQHHREISSAALDDGEDDLLPDALAEVPLALPLQPQQAPWQDRYRRFYSDPGSLPTTQYCPPRNDILARQQNLSCMRKCTADRDCQNDRKLCLCDGVCGLSCIRKNNQNSLLQRPQTRPEKECQELPDPPNGQVHLTGRNFQDKAVYTCDEGYQIVGLTKVICQASGTWSGEQPTCKAATGGAHSPYYCSKPPLIEHASHNGSQEQTFFDLDTELSYRCFPGFKPSGFDHAKCFFMNGTAQWYGPDLSCYPVDCGVPDLIIHGKGSGDCYSFRCQITYKCEPGFIIDGRSTRICQADGTWTRNELPSCKPVQCDIPSSPSNGKAEFTAVSYMSVVSYDCNTGYMLVGNSTRTCGSDRHWSGPTPECKEINCGPPGGGHLPNGWLEGSRTNFRAVITFRCIEGMVVEAESMSTTCQQDGTWSHPLPKCLAPCIVPHILNGNASRAIGSKVQHGDDIIVNCTENHEAGSESGRIACFNGTWSHLPRCDPARCKAMPTPPRNGMIVAPRTSHGAIGLYQCKDGYKLKGENTTRCDYGNWTGITPLCEEIYCQFPGYLTNGKILLVGNMGLYDYRPYVRKITNDRQIMFDCDKGYILDIGSPEGATCVDGKWSPSTIPICIQENHPSIRWLDKRSIKKEELAKMFPNITRTKRSSEGPCPELDLATLDYHIIQQKDENHTTEGSVVQVECRRGYQLTTSRSKVKCKRGEWRPETPVCSPAPCKIPHIPGGKFSSLTENKPAASTLNHGESTIFSCKQGYRTQTGVSVSVSCSNGNLSVKLECIGQPCLVPRLENGEYIQGSRANMEIDDNSYLDYTCRPGYKKPLENPLQCKGGQIIPTKPACYEDSANIRVAALSSRIDEKPAADSPVEGRKSGKPCRYTNEEENLVAFLNGREITGELDLKHGDSLVFRCSDVGKYKLNGAGSVQCSEGGLTDNIPTCEGLNQNYNYSEDLPPTILFRHENGPIAQSNSGELLVYPGTTLHMECLFQKRNGVPRWIFPETTRKTYPQGWAQGQMRDSTLEYRLSIYFAQEYDTGEYTCITPYNNSHTIDIQVRKIDCPEIPLSNGLRADTNQTRLGTEVRFSCTNGNSLVGANSLICLSQGTWSQLIPTCEKIICPDIKTVIKDSVVKITTMSEDSNRVYLACPRGYQINGETKAFCQPNRQWSLVTAPTCKAIRCRNPKLSKNLKIHRTGPFNAGDIAKYHCKPGFRLKGKPVSFCHNNGEWSNKSPYCVKACSYPGSLIRGTMDSVKFFYNIGESVNFKCSSELAMKGDSSIKCLGTGLWSGEVPICVP